MKAETGIALLVFGTIWLYVMAYIAAILGVMYVAFHFISKLW